MAQQIDVPGMGVVEFPDDMDDNQIATAIKRNMSMDKVGKPAKTGDFAGALKSELANADWGTRNVAGFGVAASDLYERGKQLFGMENRQQIDANKIIADAAPVGAFAGEMAGPASLAAMKLMPVLRGASTLGGKAMQYGGNVAIGAGVGGGLAALKPDANMETVGEGAAGGALAAGVLGPLVSAAAKGAGWAYDALKGRLGDIKAAQIVRDAAGANLAAIRAASAVAPDNLTAAQAAAGVQQDTYSALGKLMEENNKDSFYRLLRDRQTDAQRATLEGLANGTTQTAARQARGADKKALEGIFVPRMNTELAAANTGKQLAELEARAAGLGDAAANKVQDVRRMTAAADRAETMGTEFGRRNPATALGAPTGMPSAGGRNSYGQELAGRAERAAQDAANDSLILGEGQRFTEGIAASLRAHGLKPLDTNSIVGSLGRKLGDPTAAGSKKYEAVLSRVANDIQEWTARNGGQIDARALYAIRKNSVNDAVEDLTKGLDPKASAKYAAQVLGEVRPMIDNAIVEAGGTAWPQTLKIFEKGMLQIDRKKMGATALDLFNKSKTGFLDMAQGNAPKVVEKNFGPGRFDIRQEMGGKMRGLDDVAEQVARDEDLARRASAGVGGLSNILKQDVSNFRLPNPLDQRIALINRALGNMEGKINAQAMDRLDVAMRSGKNVNQLLEILPTSQRSNFLKYLMEANPALVAGSAAAQ